MGMGSVPPKRGMICHSQRAVSTALLISSIQADSASQVANLMQDILNVTEQTTAGTQRTAEAVDELTALASELKGSVAGFKVD